MQPNVSIAAVALHYQLNANLLRRWVAAREEQDVAREARQSMGAPPAEFVPLQLSAPSATPVSTEIQIEVRRGAATVTVRWPVCAAVAARRLNKGRFIWTNGDQAIATALNPEQLHALVMGLPWQTLTPDHAITVV